MNSPQLKVELSASDAAAAAESSSASVSKSCTFQSSEFETNITTTSPTTPSSPDYATIDFHRSSSRVASASPSPEKEIPAKTEEISPPKRGVKKKKNNKIESRMNENGATAKSLTQTNLDLNNNNNHNSNNNRPNSSTRIYQNLPMYTRSSITHHSNASFSEENNNNNNSYDALEERDRQFATAICECADVITFQAEFLISVFNQSFPPGIFSSVLTMVLVLMFYLVGEAAFRSILLILAFVFALTLLLACFLRRPTAIVFTNGSRSLPIQSSISTHPKLSPTYHPPSSSPPHHHQYLHQSHHHHQAQTLRSQIFMISPPPPQSIHPLCPVHSRPESRSFPPPPPPPPSPPEEVSALSPPLPLPPPLPPLPPKSPSSPSSPPPVPPIQTIPSRVNPPANQPTTTNNNNNTKRYSATSSSSSSSSTSFSQDSLEIIDKIESEKLQYCHKY